jgi:hypothetical protein
LRDAERRAIGSLVAAVVGGAVESAVFGFEQGVLNVGVAAGVIGERVDDLKGTAWRDPEDDPGAAVEVAVVAERQAGAGTLDVVLAFAAGKLVNDAQPAGGRDFEDGAGALYATLRGGTVKISVRPEGKGRLGIRALGVDAPLINRAEMVKRGEFPGGRDAENGAGGDAVKIAVPAAGEAGGGVGGVIAAGEGVEGGQFAVGGDLVNGAAVARPTRFGRTINGAVRAGRWCGFGVIAVRRAAEPREGGNLDLRERAWGEQQPGGEARQDEAQDKQ